VSKTKLQQESDAPAENTRSTKAIRNTGFTKFQNVAQRSADLWCDAFGTSIDITTNVADQLASQFGSLSESLQTSHDFHYRIIREIINSHEQFGIIWMNHIASTFANALDHTRIAGNKSSESIRALVRIVKTENDPK